MKKILAITLFVFTATFGYSQGITGDWYGAINIQGTSLPLVFHISKTGNVYSTLMDSPKQNAKGFATGITTVNGNQIIVDAANAGINYTGTYLPDSNKIAGTFKQGAVSLPLTFSRTEPAAEIRPQDPKDFPYKQEEVVFDNAKGGNRLAGTLTIPSSGKVSKIVILITGSGSQNRNEELFNHRPFLVWSDWLTRNGVAVLRHDDRGVAKSTGNFATATTADFADDVEAAINFIQSRADLKNLSIGLIGHSEGGLIAPIVASRNNAVKFLVLLAGPGIPIIQLMLQQTADQARLSGASETAVQYTIATNRKLYNTIIQNPELSATQLKQKIDTLIRQDTGLPDKDNLVAAAAPLVTPWYRYFFSIVPQSYLIKVKCPVLALNGTMDMQVNSEANLAGIKQSLEKAGNKHYEIVPLTGLNHLFQKAANGSVAEYGQLTETVNPTALQKVAAWINQL